MPTLMMLLGYVCLFRQESQASDFKCLGLDYAVWPGLERRPNLSRLSCLSTPTKHLSHPSMFALLVQGMKNKELPYDFGGHLLVFMSFLASLLR